MPLNNYLGIASLLSAFVSMMIAVYSARKAKVPSQFTIFIFFIILWSLSSAFSFFSQSIELQLFWAGLEVFSSAFFIYFWLFFICEYAIGLSIWQRRLVNWLIAVPIIATLAAWTNSYHGLFWSNYSWNAGLSSPLQFEHGPLYLFLFLPYNYLIGVFSLFILVGRFFKVRKRLRRQVAVLIIANLLPILSLTLYLKQLNNDAEIAINPTLFGILLSSLIVAVLIFRDKNFKYLPILERSLFESINNAVFMLDQNALVVDYNQGAIEIIDSLELELREMKSQSIFDILPALLHSGDLFVAEEVNIFDMELGTRFFDINIIPVKKHERDLIGYAIIVKDVSRHHKDLQRIKNLSEFRKTLLELHSNLLRNVQVDNIYQYILEQSVASIPDAEAGSVLILGDDGKYHYKAVVGYNFEELLKVTFDYDELLFAQQKKKSSYITRDLHKYNVDTLKDEKLIILDKATKNVKATLTMPIFLKDCLVAVVHLDNNTSQNAFDHEVEQTVEIFGNHIADIIHKANLQKEIDALDIFRESMLELSTKLLGQDSLHDFYQLLLSRAIEVAPKAEFASILELKDDNKFHYAASFGYDLQDPKKVILDYADLPKEIKDKSISSFLQEDYKDPILDKNVLIKSLFVAIRVEEQLKAVLILASTNKQYLLQKQSRQFAEVFASQVSAMLKRRQVENALQRGEVYDSLTGLPNRKPLLDRLKHILGLSWRNRSDFAVIFLEVDKFENISSSYGHATADLLLKYIAKRLEHSLRPGDTVSRWGNNQFVILLEQLSSKEEALEITSRLRRIISKSFLINEIEIVVSISAGVVFDNQRYEYAEEILQNADITINRAKALGMGYMVFHDDMSKELLIRLSLEKDIRTAIENDGFHLVYQPIVDLQSSEYIGFEALIRWQHEKHGLISPNKFIPLAEELGLIGKIDKWVVESAIKQIAIWDKTFPRKRGFSVSVNISADSFLEAGFYEFVNKTLETQHVKKHRIRLELTERTIMEDVKNVSEILTRLRNKGIKVLIDDFGTGYSSLSYLHKLPLDILKIDMSFIRELPDNHSQVMIKSIVSLAHNLNLEVVAEGVETNEQVAYLQSLGCEYAQGYYYAEPLNALELVQNFLTERTLLAPTS